MSKNSYKRYSNTSFTTNDKSFGESGIFHNFGNYFTIFNKNDLNFCYIFIADNFTNFLSFCGKCNLTILFGSIRINGVDFSAPFSENIYSPISHAKVTFQRAVESKNQAKSIEEIYTCLLQTNTTSENEQHIFSALLDIKDEINGSSKWNVLRMETLNCVVSDDIAQFKDFRRLFEVNTEFPFARKLKFSVIEDQNPSYNMTQEISQCLDEIAATYINKRNMTLTLVGPKDSGKSTLMRTVINRFFSEGCTEVFVIDGDPGQSEFTPNGCLTLTKVLGPLLGPPFTHQYSKNNKLVKQFFMGVISPADDPKLYCRTFENLYQSYLLLSSNKNIPLVINTMGWPQGLGLSLLTFKLFLVNPTIILQLKKGRSEKEFIDISLDSLNKQCAKDNLLKNLPRVLSSVIYILKSPVSTSSRSDFQQPIQHRDLTMLAYIFQQTMQRSLCFPIDCLPDDYRQNPVTRLRCRIPAFLNYTINGKVNSEKKSLPLVHLKLVYSEIDVTTQQSVISQCFSMQWVAICRPYNPPKYKSVISSSIYSHYKEMDPMLCIGMGLVSHVREELNEIDLLTGVDNNLLDGSYIVKGKVFSPDCLFLNQREVISKNNIPALPYISPMNTVGLGKTSMGTRMSLPKIRRHNH